MVAKRIDKPVKVPAMMALVFMLFFFTCRVVLVLGQPNPPFKQIIRRKTARRPTTGGVLKFAYCLSYCKASLSCSMAASHSFNAASRWPPKS